MAPVLQNDTDDGKFSIEKVIDALDRAWHPDGKLFIDPYVETFEYYARFVEEEYGLVGSFLAGRIRSDAEFPVKFLNEKKLVGDERTAETILLLSDKNGMRNYDWNNAGFHMLLYVAFISWIVRLYDERDDPEEPGQNFLHSGYEATLGHLHPWLIKKAAWVLLSMHKGKKYWHDTYIYNEKVFPRDTLHRTCAKYRAVRDQLAELLKVHGFEDMTFK